MVAYITQAVLHDPVRYNEEKYNHKSSLSHHYPV